jgi:hypothetical protein
MVPLRTLACTILCFPLCFRVSNLVPRTRSFPIATGSRPSWKRGPSDQFWDIGQVTSRNFNWLPFTPLPLCSPSPILQKVIGEAHDHITASVLSYILTLNRDELGKRLNEIALQMCNFSRAFFLLYLSNRMRGGIANPPPPPPDTACTP